jgi:predicted dehydrogenase
MLNVGVIGLGLMGKRHADIYKKIPFVELKAVADSRDEAINEYCNGTEVNGYKNY